MLSFDFSCDYMEMYVVLHAILLVTLCGVYNVSAISFVAFCIKEMLSQKINVDFKLSAASLISEVCVIDIDIIA